MIGRVKSGAYSTESLEAVPSVRFSAMSPYASDHCVFDASDAEDNRALLAAFVASVLGETRKAGQVPRIAVRVDGLARLTAPAMASLITALRRLREVGGELAIVTGRSDLRASLGVTGLNKVFRIVATLDDLDTALPPCVSAVHSPASRSARARCRL